MIAEGREANKNNNLREGIIASTVGKSLSGNEVEIEIVYIHQPQLGRVVRVIEDANVIPHDFNIGGPVDILDRRR